MIDVILKNYLLEKMDEHIPVLFEKPKEKPEKYVVIHIMDEGEVDHISAITISFTVSAKSMYDARTISKKIKRLLLDSVVLPVVSAAKLGGGSGGAQSNGTYENELIFNFYYFEED